MSSHVKKQKIANYNTCTTLLPIHFELHNFLPFSGLVSVLNDVHVVEVALGRAHIVVRSDDGRIWTAGVNNRGQCGRQEGTMPISQHIAEVEQEKDGMLLHTE